MKLALILIVLVVGIVARAAEDLAPVVSDNFSEWTRVDRTDGAGITYVHHDSLTTTVQPSTLSIYQVNLRDADVRKLIASLKTGGTVDAELAPVACYKLNRADLESRQTWCENGFVVAETGPISMRTRQRSQAILQRIDEAKK